MELALSLCWKAISVINLAVNMIVENRWSLDGLLRSLPQSCHQNFAASDGTFTVCHVHCAVVSDCPLPRGFRVEHKVLVTIYDFHPLHNEKAGGSARYKYILRYS